VSHNFIVSIVIAVFRSALSAVSSSVSDTKRNFQVKSVVKSSFHSLLPKRAELRKAAQEAAAEKMLTIKTITLLRGKRHWTDGQAANN